MQELKQIVGKIKKGTCFLVSKEYILTARHCVEDVSISTEIDIEFSELRIVKKAVLVEKLERPLDLAILKLIEPFENNPKLKICTDIIFREDKFCSFGYSSEESELGKIILGQVNDSDLTLNEYLDLNDEIDLKLFSKELVNIHPDFLSGYSGSPIIIGGQIVGIIKNCFFDKILGAQQLSNFKETFKKYGIEYQEKNYLRQKLYKKSLDELTANKYSKKYIPDIYTEIPELKEKIRYFSLPTLFFKKFLNNFINFDCTYLNSILEEIQLKKLNFKEHENKSLEDLEKIKISIKDNISYLEKLNHFEILDKEKMEQPPLSYLKYKLMNNLNYELKDFLEIIELFKSKTLLLVDNAGKGKTTFLCDVVENLYFKRNIDCIFISAHKIQDGDIVQYLTREFFDYSSFINKLEYMAKKDKKIIIFIIDGINENDNLKNFSENLVHFIETIQEKENLKIILSCRREYLSERFKRLMLLNHENKISLIENVFKAENFFRREHLNNYFKYFNIKASLSLEVEDKLMENPLLLRFFCEAYQDCNCSEILSLYKYNLFVTYTENKIKALEEKGQNIGELENIFQIISEYMLKNKTFSQIPINIIKNNNFIKEIIYEDIIFKDGLKKVMSSMGRTIEVLSYTFDEYRDYHLAWYIKDNLSPEEAEENLESLKETPIIEGVSKYLYQIAKELNDNNLINILERKISTVEPFLEYIFGIEDCNIKKEDLLKLEEIFNSTPEYNFLILRNLFLRNEEKYRNLNINHIFKFINKMSEFNYWNKFLIHFKTSNYFNDNSKECLHSYINATNRIFNENKPVLAFKLLILLLPLIQRQYSKFYFNTLEKILEKNLNSDKIIEIINNIENEVLLNSILKEFEE